MAAAYPAAYDAMSAPAASLSGPPLHSAMHTQINQVLAALEAELGLDPSGTFATVRARLDALSPPGAKRVRLGGGTLNTANASVGYVSFPTEVYDTAALHENVTNPTRITIPAGGAGLWSVGYTIDYANTGTGDRQSWISVNRGGTPTRLGMSTIPGGNGQLVPVVAASTEGVLAVGDYLELAVYQISGSALAIGGAGVTTMFASFIGP
jgi:hypothetical protein